MLQKLCAVTCDDVHNNESKENHECGDKPLMHDIRPSQPPVGMSREQQRAADQEGHGNEQLYNSGESQQPVNRGIRHADIAKVPVKLFIPVFAGPSKQAQIRAVEEFIQTIQQPESEPICSESRGLKRFGINLRQKIILKRSDKPIWCTRFDFM
ncbi:hypothetical protein [Halovulum sp. GXIMD14793]